MLMMILKYFKEHVNIISELVSYMGSREEGL